MGNILNFHEKTIQKIGSSVVDPGCLSRIPDPDFYPSRIPDPKQQQKRGVKKLVVIPFFRSHKFHKIANYFILLMLKKKIWPILKKL
jgi:hypothetical protein